MLSSRYSARGRVLLSLGILSMGCGAVAQAGTFTSLPLSGDSDSGIRADADYTVAYNFGDSTNLNINGAVFTPVGSSPNTNNLSSSGIGNSFTGLITAVTGSTNDLFDNFIYGGTPATLTLNNLRVGQQYVSTFYNSAFGSPGGRVVSFATSDGGSLVNYDQNALPSSLLQYAFTASSSTMSFTITPQSLPDTFHQYAFSNQLLGYKALFTDNFFAAGNPNTNDVNFNLAARQGGSLVLSGGPISYTVNGNSQVGNTTGGIDSGNYLLSAFGARTALNHNFKGAESAGGLSVSFDFAPNSVNHGDTTEWEAFNLGLADTDRDKAVNDPASHFGILFRGNGNIQAFDGSTLVSGSETWGAGSTNTLHHVEVLLTDPTDSNPFDGVGQTNVAVYSDGALIYTYIKTGGGYSNNNISLQNVGIGGADNLSVAQAVPEPSVLISLLGGMGVLIGLRRRL